LEGSGNILISGNILLFTGANGKKKTINQKRRCPDRNTEASDYEEKKEESATRKRRTSD
jgi:hypothetical protein